MSESTHKNESIKLGVQKDNVNSSVNQNSDGGSSSQESGGHEEDSQFEGRFEEFSGEEPMTLPEPLEDGIQNATETNH